MPMARPILLAIEDDQPIVELFAALAAPIGMKLVSAGSGREALNMLRHLRPAITTLDLVLPDIDGFAVLEQIRQRRELDDMPVIVISAISDSTAVKGAYALGASDFVSKPFNVDLLDAKLRVFSRMRRLAEEVRERERFLDEVIEHVSTGLLVCDADGKVLRVNSAGAAQLGLRDPWSATGRLLAEVAPGAEAFLNVEPGSTQRRALIRTAAGETALGFTSTALDGGGVVVVFRELAAAEVARREAEERVRLQALARAARSFAHEVRNPVAAIAAAAQVVAREEADPAMRKRLALAVEGEARRIAGLVVEYVDRQTPPPPTGSVDLRALLDEVMEVNLLGAGPRGRVVLECAPQLPKVRGDRARLKQVVLNLLLNAIAATEQSGAIRLGAVGDGSGAGVIFTVHDSGHGIKPADLPRIFEELFTTRAGGDGLGLPIARRIVEEHGGRLEVEAEAGRRTVFTVWLPAD
ncbi:MAG: hybrid sensor histidine kinase/response regulator [Myxococcales bacterium]|nr:hybrid sensor histidine kinase/response regulator [Myxococcales bacterium]